MQPSDFVACHLPALETDEVRHNLLLGMLGRLATDPTLDYRVWSLGSPGACALQTAPIRPIILGELSPPQCRALAEQTLGLDHPGVVGPDLTAKFFADRAGELGLTFLEPVPQQIHALAGRPRYPGAPGTARLVQPDDAPLLVDWTLAFSREATPLDPLPDREQMAKAASEGRHMFWIVDGEPVAMAAIVRRTRNAAAIAAVYTPPARRGRGYAGSVTAAVVELAFAQGKTVACLYTNLRNPASNRCYARIGFTPVCPSWHYPRIRTATP